MLSHEFYLKYALGLFESAYLNLIKAHTEYVSPRTLTNSLSIIICSLDVEKIYELVHPHLEDMLLDHLIPLLSINTKDEEYSNHEPAQYIYSHKVWTDDHNSVKHRASELISLLCPMQAPDKVKYEFKLLNFVGYCLTKMVNPRNNQQVDFLAKEYLLAAAECTAESIRLQPEALMKLEGFAENCVIPELMSDLPLLRARACSFISMLGGVIPYRNPENIMRICQGICNCMTSKNLVVKVAAVEALTVVISNNQARDLLKPDIQHFLDHILDMMNLIELDDLVEALETIASHFGDSFGPYTCQLVESLSKCFYEYKNRGSNPEDIVDEFLGSEAETAAEACLDSINNILKSNTDPIIFEKVSCFVLDLVNTTIVDKEAILFEKCLSLLNVLLFNSRVLDDQIKSFYPLLCFRIMNKVPERKPFSIVVTNLTPLDDLSAAVGCFLNYMQKLGQEFLASSVDGKKYIDLMFNVIQSIGDECFKNNSFGNLIFSLRILIGLLENFRGQINHQIEQIFGIVFELLPTSEDHEALKSMLMQVIAIMFWYDPVLMMDLLDARNCKMDTLVKWFGSLGIFQTEHEKERELYGIGALLSLPKNKFPEGLKFEAVMMEVINVSREVVEFKKSGGRIAGAFVEEEDMPRQSQRMNDEQDAFDAEDDDEESVAASNPERRTHRFECAAVQQSVRAVQLCDVRVRSAGRQEPPGPAVFPRTDQLDQA